MVCYVSQDAARWALVMLPCQGVSMDKRQGRSGVMPTKVALNFLRKEEYAMSATELLEAEPNLELPSDVECPL